MPIQSAIQAQAPGAAQIGPFTVQYFCPRQSPYWQGSNAGPVPAWSQAVGLAQILKPTRGSARVLNLYGQTVYEI